MPPSVKCYAHGANEVLDITFVMQTITDPPVTDDSCQMVWRDLKSEARHDL